MQNALSGTKTYDYCTCGVIQYTYGLEYPLRLDNFSGELSNYLEANHYATAEEIKIFIEESDAKFKKTDSNKPYRVSLPYIINHFDISKDEYLKFREEQCEKYKSAPGYSYDLLTEREIEIIFGDYSEETIMKELKTATSFYYEGALYDAYALAAWADDELLLEFLEMDWFQLYLFDLENLEYSNPLFYRIEKLQAENAE